jgi:tetratricopeptide (TPR) repeat protein
MLLTWCGVVTAIPGSDTPDTLRSRNNLATAYVAAGRTDGAIPLLRQVLATREKVLGPDHPDTLTSLNNLAIAYVAAGRTDDAIPLLRQVLATREKVLGPDDPDTQASRRMLEEVNSQVSRSSEA